MLCVTFSSKRFSLIALTTSLMLPCFPSVYQQAKQRGLTLSIKQSPDAPQAEIREAHKKSLLVQYRCKLLLTPPPTERMDSFQFHSIVSIVQTATYRTVPFGFGLISFTVKMFPPCFHSTSNCINMAQRAHY